MGGARAGNVAGTARARGGAGRRAERKLESRCRRLWGASAEFWAHVCRSDQLSEGQLGKLHSKPAVGKDGVPSDPDPEAGVAEGAWWVSLVGTLQNPGGHRLLVAVHELLGVTSLLFNNFFSLYFFHCHVSPFHFHPTPF